jgi:hypothetical protein
MNWLEVIRGCHDKWPRRANQLNALHVFFRWGNPNHSSILLSVVLGVKNPAHTLLGNQREHGKMAGLQQAGNMAELRLGRNFAL